MSRFRIYNASAGAGKTYQLVRDYLRICLGSENPRNFMRILAITFTNKAANEMKVRIIDQLKLLADPTVPQKGSMLNDLCSDLEIEESELRVRAGKCLSAILHEYSAFSVSTIDGFNNRLIRNFARDLQVNGNYEVEMESDDMLMEAVDELLSKLHEKSASTDIILGFVENQLDSGNSPRPEHSLMQAGQNLFKEEAFPHLRRLRPYTPEHFKKLIKDLTKARRQIEIQVEQMAADALDLIKQNGLEQDHFSRGIPFTYFTYLLKGDTAKWNPGTMIYKLVNGESEFYTKANKAAYGPLFAPIEQELLSKLIRLVSFIEEHYAQHRLISSILKNVYGTAVITEIDRRLQVVKDNTNRLPIGEFNKLIGEKLNQEPAEYLFERLGEKYSYFFIDEFQDTSSLQWKNLLPLINNAMAANGEVLLVGDPKQSIYRWRGGEVDQFIKLNKDSDTSNKLMLNGKLVELYKRFSFNLPKNYRSKSVVVEFNNEFFSMAAGLVGRTEFSELYRNSSQQIHHDQDGFVQIKLLEYESQDKKLYVEHQCKQCESTIKDANERGINYGDMCILVRSNKRGTLIAQHLLEAGLPVISPDALALGGSREVNALVSGLKMLNQAYQKSFRYHFLEYLAELPGVSSLFPDKHDFISRFCHASPEQLFKQISELTPLFNYDQLQLLSLGDLVFQIIRALQMNVQGNPFLHAFIDKLREYELKEGEDLPGFLRWWDERGHKINISTPETTNAVQVMSIHKSKGLEFPLCILAFADWHTEREVGATKKWLDLDFKSEIDLPAAWVNLSKDDSGLGYSELSDMYREHKELVNFDNINLLYVAFTRAIDELYVFGAKEIDSPDQRVSRYLTPFLEHYDAEDHLSFGEPPESESGMPESQELFENYPSTNWRDRLRVVAEAPEEWSGKEISEAISKGKMIHGLLAEIYTEQDVQPVVDRHHKAGNLSKKEATQVAALLLKIVTHNELTKYFQSGLELINEVDILEPGGGISRPDRVVISNDQAHIIDYKTGAPRSSHREQMDSYRSLLRSMGFPAGNNILAYLSNDIKIEQWQSN